MRRHGAARFGDVSGEVYGSCGCRRLYVSYPRTEHVFRLEQADPSDMMLPKHAVLVGNNSAYDQILASMLG